MQYISTRSKDKSASKRSFSQILLEGLAPDGGLYMPESYPVVTGQELDKWRSLSYAELLLKFSESLQTTFRKRPENAGRKDLYT